MEQLITTREQLLRQLTACNPLSIEFIRIAKEIRINELKTNKMSNLQLSLKKQWFDLTKSGIKTEDYREITPYWCRRFYHCMTESNTTPECVRLNLPKNEILNCSDCSMGLSYLKTFGSNIMTLGYPKSTDSERILKLEHKGIEIRTGNPEWGAEPNKLYFVILHGRFLK